MFVVIVEIHSSAEGAEDLRRQHTLYSELAGRHPGILYKHVMRSDQDPTRFIDIMAWERQDQSETFGVDPEYQAQRRTMNRSVGTWLPASPINPGYFDRVVGSGDQTGDRQSVVFIRTVPGQEQAFLSRLPATPGLRAYRNNGYPNQFVVAVQPDTALPDWSDLATVPPRLDSGTLVVRYDFATGAGP